MPRGRKTQTPAEAQKAGTVRDARREALSKVIAQALPAQVRDQLGYAAYKTRASATDLGVALHNVLTGQIQTPEKE